MLWKNKIDSIVKSHLDAQVKETLKYKGAFMLANNPANAQLWCAIAGLSRQLFDLNLKFNYLERALKDIGKAKTQNKRVIRKRKK